MVEYLKFSGLAWFQQSGSDGLSGVLPWILILAFMIVATLILILARNQNEQSQKLEKKVDHLLEAVSAISQTSRENTDRLVGAIAELTQSNRDLAAEFEESEQPAPQVSTPKAKQASPVESATPEAQPMPEQEAPSNPTDDGDSFDQAISLLQDMEADHPANLLRARELFLKHTGGDKNAQAQTYLAETLFWLGDIATSDADKEKYHGEGVEYGKKAVELNSRSAAAHLWYAANMGSHGMVRGIMQSLFYVSPIEKHGKKAMDLDEGYFQAAPARLLGRFYHQCPPFPISKGDKKKAVKLLESAVQKGPDFLLNHYYLADLYLAMRRKSEAKKLLKQIIDTKEFKIMPEYHKNVQAIAQKLIAKV